MCLAVKVYAQRSCMITAGSRKLTILTIDGMERGEVGLGLWRSWDNGNYAYILHTTPYIFSILSS